jgi:Membrane fusion protein Use1
VLQIHTLITQTQLERSNFPESEEEEDHPKESDNIKTTPLAGNESTSVLRNRLFGDAKEEQDLSTEHVLSHHRMLQDDIAESMVGMARNLKDRSIAFGEALREDSKVSLLRTRTHGQFIQNATELLSKNADRMTQTGGKLQTYSNTSKSMTWFILGAIVVVFVAWLAMYFLIRITYFVR